MKPGDLVKFRQNFLYPDGFGEVHDFSGCLALLIEPYTGHYWRVMINGKIRAVSISDIACVI